MDLIAHSRDVPASGAVVSSANEGTSGGKEFPLELHCFHGSREQVPCHIAELTEFVVGLGDHLSEQASGDVDAEYSHARTAAGVGGRILWSLWPHLAAIVGRASFGAVLGGEGMDLRQVRDLKALGGPPLGTVGRRRLDGSFRRQGQQGFCGSRPRRRSRSSTRVPSPLLRTDICRRLLGYKPILHTRAVIAVIDAWEVTN